MADDQIVEQEQTSTGDVSPEAETQDKTETQPQPQYLTQEALAATSGQAAVSTFMCCCPATSFRRASECGP